MQDRLPGELRLLGVTDIDGANNVLPRLIAKHNEKFAVLPAEQESAYVEPVEKVDVDFLFAHREMRNTKSRLMWIASPDVAPKFGYANQRFAASLMKGEVVRISEPEGLFLRLNTPQPLRGSPPCRGAPRGNKTSFKRELV